MAAVYDHAWYMGTIVERDEENKDVVVNFVRATVKPGFFQWPRKKDECWVPLEHMLCIMSAPSTATVRQYAFDKNTVAEAEVLFQQFADRHYSCFCMATGSN